jgi:hypothetical protein
VTRNVKMLIACAAIFGIMSVWAPQASAQFKSGEAKSDKGSSYAAAVALKDGSATIECEAAETKAVGSWTVENEKHEEVEKGSSLVFEYKDWDSCVTESSGIETKAGATTGGECEMEVQQPNEETKSAVTVKSSCVFKIEVNKEATCEVRVEPEGNKERNDALFNYSGEDDESLILTLAAKGITAKAKGTGCEKAKIKESSAEAELTGNVDEVMVAAQGQAPLYTLSRTDANAANAGLDEAGVRREVTVRYTGNSTTAVMPGSTLTLQEIQTRTGVAPELIYFGTTNRSLAECVTFSFTTLAQRCTMEVEAVRLPTRKIGTIQGIFKYETGNQRSAVMLIVEY